MDASSSDGNSNQGKRDEPSIDEQIRLENAKRAAYDAERRNSEQKEKERKSKAKLKLIKRVPIKMVLIAVAVIAAAVIFLQAFIIPAMSPKPEPTYLAESDLEKVISVSNISAVDYVYKGIAEKWAADIFGKHVDYRIRYTAHVRANFDMNNIVFDIDEEKKTISVTIPDPIIEAPEVDEQSLDYMPENHPGHIAEAIALCKEDVAHEVKEEDLILEKAYANIRTTIRALTFPLVGEEYEFIWLKADGTSLGGEAE